jgi:hypothetical protein
MTISLFGKENWQQLAKGVGREADFSALLLTGA